MGPSCNRERKESFMRILQTTHLTKEYGQDASLVNALDDVSKSV